MDDSFKNLILQAKSVLILLPHRPDLDQVAAGLSLFLSLRDSKDVSISCPSPMTVEFNQLIAVNKIVEELGNKNLVVSFADYKASDIERVSYDIEDGRFKLTVIPKSGVTPPEKDQVVLSYSGVSSDMVILIGGLNEASFPALTSKDLAGAKTVHIGISALQGEATKGIISLARPASSISELMTMLIHESSLTLDADIATNLIAGIEETTNFFTNPNVTADTFSVISELMKLGGRRPRGVTLQKETFPPGSIPGEVPQQEMFNAAPKEDVEAPPNDWLKPKIFKGASVS